MDSTDTKTILKDVDKRLAKAILSRLKALEKRKISINAMEKEALKKGLSPKEFREEVVAGLTLLYRSKLTSLSKSEDEIGREADRIVAGYEYKRNHAEDEKKEEDLNEIRDVERRMDAILGIYSPLISNLEKHANEYIERLNIPKEDAAEYKITEESLNAILNGGDDLIKRMSDIHYLILKKFVDVVNFKKYNEEYKAKTEHYYAIDPNVLFRETVLKIYAKLQVHLNVVKKILLEKQKELSDAKINTYHLPEVFEQAKELLKRLATLGDSMIEDPELNADLKSKILVGEALSNKVNEMLGKVTFSKEGPTRRTEEHHESEEDEPEETEERERKPWLQRIKEKFRGIIPARGKEGKKRGKTSLTDRFKHDVKVIKLSDEDKEALVRTYKTKIVEYNSKVEKLDEVNNAIKALYGGITAATVEDIYNELTTSTIFNTSYVDIVAKESEARKLRRELDSLGISIIAARTDYLAGTGRSITSVEGLASLSMNKPKVVHELSSIMEFVLLHDKNRLVMEHRLNEIAADLADPSLPSEQRTKLEEEKTRVEGYIRSETSIITRAVVEACQADRTLTVEKINEQRKPKIEEIKAEIKDKLVKKKHAPIPPSGPTIEELLVALGIKDAIDGLGIPNIYDELDANRTTLINNIAIIKGNGLEPLIGKTDSYKMLIDPKFKDVLDFLTINGLTPSKFAILELPPIFEKYNDYASLSLDQFKDLVKAKMVEKTKPILDATGYDLLKMEDMSMRNMLMLALSMLGNETAINILADNVKVLKELGLESHMYEKKYQSIVYYSELKSKYQALVDAGISKEEIVDKWLDKLLSPSIPLEALKAELPAKRTEPLTREDILAKFADLKTYPELEKAPFESLKILLDVPEELIRKNDAYVAEKFPGSMLTVEYLTCVDLEEKCKYAYPKDPDLDAGFFIRDYLSISFEEFKTAIDNKVAKIIELYKNEFGLDISGIYKAKIIMYYGSIKKIDAIKENLEILKKFFSGEEIVSELDKRVRIFMHLEDPEIKNKYEYIRGKGITDEEIKTNRDILFEFDYDEIDEKISEIISARAPKPKTPEEEKAELVAKFEGLGIPKLKDCLLADLKMLAEANENLVKKNAEYIKTHLKHTDYTVSSICVYLTCVDFDKKWEYLNSSVKINLPVIIKDTKNMTFEEFKEFFNKEIKSMIEAIKKDTDLDLNRCKEVSEVELLKLSFAYRLELTKTQVKDNISTLKVLFATEEIYEKFSATDLFGATLSKNIERMREKGLTDEEIKANYTLITLVSPTEGILDAKINEIIAARKKDEEPVKEEPKLEGPSIQSSKIELSRLRMSPTKPQEADRTVGAIERAVPMLKVEVYKNGIRVELYKEVKEQLQDLQLKVSLIKRKNNGEWYKNAVKGTTHDISDGSAVEYVSENFDPEKVGIKVQASYHDEDGNYLEDSGNMRIR